MKSYGIVKLARTTVVAALVAYTSLPLFSDDRKTDVVNGVEWTYFVRDGKAIVGFSEEMTDEWGHTYTHDYPAVSEDTGGAVAIPAKLGGYPVVGINDGAFEDCENIASITVPNGVKTIGYAFAWCSSLTKITIPASVTDIADDAFTWCARLATINLNSNNKSFVYTGGMLLSADKKRILAVSRAATSISIPNGVTVLPCGLLGGCKKLTAVTLPKSVTETNEGWADAFGYGTCTSLKTIKVDAKNPALKVVNGILFDKSDPSYTAYIPAGLTSVTIPASVKEIDLYTATKCSKLSVDAKNPWYKSANNCIMTKDGKTLVAVAPGLESIVIPNGVEILDDGSLAEVAKGASVTIPASVKQIGVDHSREYYHEELGTWSGYDQAVFSRNLNSILFLGNPPPTLVDSPFEYLNAGDHSPEPWNGEIRVSVYSVGAWRDFFFNNAPFLYGKVLGGLPDEPTFKYASRYDYNWGNSEDGEYEPDYGGGIVITGGSGVKGAVTIPAQIDGQTVTGIGRKAFKKNTKITSVAIPETVNKIGYNAFGSCTALKKATVAGGDGVDMGKFVFSGCSGLAKNGFVVVNGVLYHYIGKGGVVTIPSTVRVIDDEVFRGNKKISAVNIPSSVLEIRDEAFEDCSKLTRVTFAEGSRILGERAFWGCWAMQRYNIPASAILYEVEDSGFAPVDSWFDPIGFSRKLKSFTGPESDYVDWEYTVPSSVKINETVNVAFDAAGGTVDGEAKVRIKVAYLDALWSVAPTLYTPVRKGYTFNGWYTAKTKGAKISANTTVSKAVTYYAQWTPKKYKITVKAGTGGKAAKTGSYSCGSTVKFTATPNKGYVFVRWDDSEFDEVYEEERDILWTKYAKQYRQAPLSLKVPAGNLTLKAVFAKASADSAVPAVGIGWDGPWNLETDGDAVIPVTVSGSLSYPSVRASNLPAGVSLSMGEDDEHYVLKVADAKKLKPGVKIVTVTATNRAGKKGTAKISIIGRNVTTAIDKGFMYGLDTSTTYGYRFDGGVKTSWTLADLGASLGSGCKLTKVTGLPSGWKFANGKVSGVAAPGTYTIYFTVAKGKTSYQASAMFTVNSLPVWATGTFCGSVECMKSGQDWDFLVGNVTISITAAGKVSGSFTDIDSNSKCTFSGTGLTYGEDGGMSARVSGKLGSKSVSFNIWLGEGRSAAFAFASGKLTYSSFNCYQAFGTAKYGGSEDGYRSIVGKTLSFSDDPYTVSQDGSTRNSKYTLTFGANGTVKIKSTFTYKSGKKSWAFKASSSSRIVKDDHSGRTFIPIALKYDNGETTTALSIELIFHYEDDGKYGYQFVMRYPGAYDDW